MKLLTEKEATAAVLQVCNLLMEEKEFARQQSLKYFRLFNEQVPEGGAALKLATDGNTPFMEFLQRMAEHHATRLLTIDKRIAELQIAVNKMELQP